jgi:hypothetical protein
MRRNFFGRLPWTANGYLPMNFSKLVLVVSCSFSFVIQVYSDLVLPVFKFIPTWFFLFSSLFQL